jgi:hypothetical protein
MSTSTTFVRSRTLNPKVSNVFCVILILSSSIQSCDCFKGRGGTSLSLSCCVPSFTSNIYACCCCWLLRQDMITLTSLHIYVSIYLQHLSSGFPLFIEAAPWWIITIIPCLLPAVQSNLQMKTVCHCSFVLLTRRKAGFPKRQRVWVDCWVGINRLQDHFLVAFGLIVGFESSNCLQYHFLVASIYSKASCICLCAACCISLTFLIVRADIRRSSDL